MAVGDFLRAVQQDFGAVVELWRAIHREQQGERLFQQERVLSVAEEAVGVVVFNEGHHALRVFVEIVIDERVVDAVVAVPPVVGFLAFRLVELVVEREVHDGGQMGVQRREFRVLLPGGGVGRFRHPGFAHGVEVGIFLAEALHPLGHRLAVGVGVGVHANAVDAYGFNPPDGILDEGVEHVRIALVEVGHRGHKPSVGGFAEVDFRGVGV